MELNGIIISNKKFKHNAEQANVVMHERSRKQ